jgi:hypothetical protein
MGYLDNSSVTVDAILTNKGRQVLASGGRLEISKFALSDDEIDYDLWNPSHTLGSNYYGKVIEDMPILEALPDETQMLRYKLVTLPKDVIGIPQISVQPGSVSFSRLTQSVTVTPSTLNLSGGNSTLGYTAILSDDTVASLEVAPDGVVSTAVSAADASVTNFIDDEVSMATTAGRTITAVGTKFILRPMGLLTAKNALLTIIGNETGGFKTVTVSVTEGTIVASSDILSTRVSSIPRGGMSSI